MKPSELARDFSFELPRLRGRSRAAVARALTIEDLRRVAKRSLPKVIFDYVDLGAEDLLALRRNRDDFESTMLLPQMLRDVSEVDLTTSFLGVEAAAPLALAPAGFTSLIRRGGEAASARAAAAGGVPYIVSTMTNTPLEEVGSPGAGSPLMFQLYMLRDRGVCEDLLRRADRSGYSALIFTVDSQTPGRRERDMRNGLAMPPSITPRALLDGALHPGWALAYARGEPLTLANFDANLSTGSLVEYMGREVDTSVSWEDIAWIREHWRKPLAIKGILSADDARTARDNGADAVVISNHGGRQVDSAPSSISVLPEVVDAVGEELEVLIDSGIRRGSDIAKAIALGARACLVGRPYLYGLAADGEAGAQKAIEILTDELRRTMALIGATSLADLDSHLVRFAR